ncbi:MAG: HAMP domain-containing protein, partial [Nanoarchaeota archaeon]|nr:HAMP domain-containing protein [Nanoarchaeota archaeon]
ITSCFNNENSTTTEYTNYIGENVIGNHIYIKELDICVFSERPISDFSKIQNMILFALLIILLFLISISTIIATIISNKISKPITQLRDASKKFTEKGVFKKIKLKQNDEIGDLFNSFNNMAQKISEQKKDLEKKVKTRTSELDKKIIELENSEKSMLNMLEDSDETNKEITQAQKKLSKALIDLKKLDKQKDAFLSITAHELKTPLTSIHGFAQLLKDNKTKIKMRKEYLTIIETETERLSKLITEMLELSRIDLGTVKLTIENTNVKEIIEQTILQITEHANKKGIKIEKEIDAKIPDLQTDSEKLFQILLNLASNAVKYSEKGIIKISAKKADKNIQFSVKDNGVGIPKKHYNKLFTRFYQVDASYSRKVGGTGLGLSICKEFTKVLGGKIWFKSSERKGTTFYFTIPLQKE